MEQTAATKTRFQLLAPWDRFQISETSKVQMRKLFQLWSETVTSQKGVSRKEGKVLQVWEGWALRWPDTRGRVAATCCSDKNVCSTH